MAALQDLVDAKHSVMMIEHHLDVIAQADWVIDLGPGGKTHGTHLVAAGSPEFLMTVPQSLTKASLIEQGYGSTLRQKANHYLGVS